MTIIVIWYIHKAKKQMCSWKSYKFWLFWRLRHFCEWQTSKDYFFVVVVLVVQGTFVYHFFGKFCLKWINSPVWFSPVLSSSVLFRQVQSSSILSNPSPILFICTILHSPRSLIWTVFTALLFHEFVFFFYVLDKVFF